MDGKALLPVKAQAMDSEEMHAWFGGRISRRLLAIPFGGPIPAKDAPRGVDLDGEWFSERTDIYGPYKALRTYRERPVDFMHANDVLGHRLDSVIVGKAVLDAEPEEDGWWADLWLKAQEKRLSLIKSLAERGGQLFGSSQATYKKANPDTGEITEWPYYIQTIAPTPQNTYSVIRPKAVLDGVNEAQIELASPLKAWLADLDALGANLPQTFPDGGDAAATATRLDDRMPELLEAWGVHKQ